MPPVDFEKVWQEVQGQFRGSLMGIHGLGHWRQVERNGLLLAEKNGLAKEGILVVRLFAALHDSQRVNDGWDDGHGARAAHYAREMRGKLYDVDDAMFETLARACRGHELGFVSPDLVIGSCWDADRLDLVRIGASPDEKLMSTPAGRAMARRGSA